MQKEVGVLIRVSTDEQAETDSPKHHEMRGKAYAQSKDWNVKEVYHLEGFSGGSVMGYPEFKRMLNDVRRGHISALIFSDLSRLSRNAKELLEISELFKKHNADMVSLRESIDTSTPGGMLYYTVLAGLAQHGRAEIISRVKASVATRAKLGKTLGGDPPYGYKWVNQELVLDEKEAPIRKLMFELFLEHKRKMKVVSILNERGYRSRKGIDFNTTLLTRCLEDSIAMGRRRVNYTTSASGGKKKQLKPKEEWVMVDVPAIVSVELYDAVNTILSKEKEGKTKKRRPGVHLFSGLVVCHCGNKMYMRSNSPRYVCSDYKNCKNQILPEDLELLYTTRLKGILDSETELEQHIRNERNQITVLQAELKGHKEQVTALNDRIKQTLDLYYAGQIKVDAFKGYHDPLVTERDQHISAVNELQAKIDELGVKTFSDKYVLDEAKDLQAQWPTFMPEQKRQIIERITKRITVYVDRVDIGLYAIATTFNGFGPSELTHPASIQVFTLAPHPTSFELVQETNNPVQGVH